MHHGEDAGGDQNGKRGGGLENFDMRDEVEPQGREIRSDFEEEVAVRELLGVGAEVVVEGREDGDGGNEAREGAGVGGSEVDEVRKVRELLGGGAEVVVEEREDGNEGNEGEADAGEIDFDEERAVLELLGVQVGELDCELEESEVEAVVLGLNQPRDGEEVRQLTTSLFRLSLTNMQRGLLRCTCYVGDHYLPPNDAGIHNAITDPEAEDAMNVDPPERDEDAMDVDSDEDTMDVDTVPFL